MELESDQSIYKVIRTKGTEGCSNCERHKRSPGNTHCDEFVKERKEEGLMDCSFGDMEYIYVLK